MTIARPVLVLTGAAGTVGRILRPALEEHYVVRGVDRAREGLLDGDVAGDLRDSEVVARALESADALVHLAAIANPRATWAEVFAENVLATQGLLVAAADRGIGRIVLASSVHAMGEYNRPEYYPIQSSWMPRPCCPYGASKVVAETIAAMYAATVPGSAVSAIRFGLVGWPLTEARHLGHWLSPGDARRLVLAALAANPGYGCYFGVSKNTRVQWETVTAAARLGYQPLDDSEALADQAGPPTSSVCRLFGPMENPPSPREEGSAR